ncbi:hypothetical protein SRABI128_05835 [Microbacterium sp. Bi128]|nr:hypothetical protein SRABI128_05835 [Microbacterium sp. Bi128]
MGRRMSGGEAWAIVEPSTNWTMECTTDCGWTTTSIFSRGMSKSRCDSITSRPLLTRLAELVVTMRPMSQVGWARASWGETSCSSSRVLPRNGPPDAVRISRSTSAAEPERRHWAMAECSESTGTICPSRAAALTRAPPTIRDSLLASASVAPEARAARVGASPIEPVMPLRTTSAVISATRVEASGPVMSSGLYPMSPAARAASSIMRRRAEASPEATPTAWARVWTACRARSSRLLPPALSATTSKRCGAPSTTSIACVPMEPVDPRRTILRGCMIQVSRTAPVRRVRLEVALHGSRGVQQCREVPARRRRVESSAAR